MQAGADIEAADALGRRALHVAALSAHKACLLALLENKAAVDAQDAGGQTALALAAFQVQWPWRAGLGGMHRACTPAAATAGCSAAALPLQSPPSQRLQALAHAHMCRATRRACGRCWPSARLALWRTAAVGARCTWRPAAAMSAAWQRCSRPAPTTKLRMATAGRLRRWRQPAARRPASERCSLRARLWLPAAATGARRCTGPREGGMKRVCKGC